MIAALCKAIQEKKAPVVAGLDPALSMIPSPLMEKAKKEHGETLTAAAEAILSFNKELMDALSDIVPAVKPQIAMYERFGAEGVRVYAETISYAKRQGLFVIADVKRGDIGSTAEAYADAHLGSVIAFGKTFAPFDADFATVNPYLGSDGVKPFIEVCKRHDKGIFVLVKTSNPASGELQDRLLDTGGSVYEQMASFVSEWGEESMDGTYSNVGAVVGATYPEIGKKLRERMPHTFFLVPGYGAQGATAADLREFFHPGGTGAIVNSSRGIIAAWQKGAFAESETMEGAAGKAARNAAKGMIQALQKELRMV